MIKESNPETCNDCRVDEVIDRVNASIEKKKKDEEELKKQYDKSIEEAIKGVSRGQPFKYIFILLRTKEMCLAAVKFEAEHYNTSDTLRDVPMGNLNYVMKHMREIKKEDQMYLQTLEEHYDRMRKVEENPKYYGEYKSYQGMLDYHKASDNDEVAWKIYAEFAAKQAKND